MEQATINLFADMGVQPATLMAGLVGASKSTDTAGPGVTITIPQNNTVTINGGYAVVSGTAPTSRPPMASISLPTW